MTQPQADPLPTEVEPHFVQMGGDLAAICQGDEDRWTSFFRSFDRALRTTEMLSERNSSDRSAWTSFSTTFAQSIANNLGALRLEAEWTQQQLATAMSGIGFSWKRVTVAEVETNARRVSLEELLGLAVLFGVPLVELIVPTEEFLEWHTQDLPSSMVMELIVGRGGRVGEGGARWLAAAKAAGGPIGAEDERPAPDLWRNRASRAKGQTTPH